MISTKVPSPDLSICIVTTNAINHIRDCLKSIQEFSSGISVEVIVSDNQSVDGTVAVIRQYFPNVKLVIDANRGYGAACNRGMRMSSGRYIMALNDDTRFFDDSLKRMIDYMDGHDDVAMIGPRLLNADGTLQPSITNFPHFYNDVGHVVLPRKVQLNTEVTRRLFAILKKITGWRMGRYDDHRSVAQVDCVKGACMVIRRSAFEKVGGFDEGIYLDTDEQGWTINLIRNGLKIVYFPDASVIHLGGQTIGSLYGVPGPRFIQKYKSNLYFYAKHYGQPYALIFRLSMGTALLLRSFIAIVSLPLGTAEIRRLKLKELEIYWYTLRMLFDMKLREKNVLKEINFRYQ